MDNMTHVKHIIIVLAVIGQGCCSRSLRDTNIPCRFEGITRREHAGTILSPGFPLSYPNNICLTWSIQAPRQGVITIHFQSLQIDRSEGGSCYQDYVQIGPVPIVTICGNHTTPYISQRDHVWIKFKSDRRRSAPGFKLIYMTGPPSSVTCLDGEFRCKNGKCILADWRCDGLFHCTDHSDEANCQQVTHPSTPPSFPHQCDGTQINCISAITNQLVCVNEDKICNGFDDCLHKEDEDSSVCVGRCHYDLTDFYGSFHSPNYPRFYPKNKDCTWTIHIPEGKIQLHFVFFLLEDSPGTDFVEIYDGKNEVNKNIMGRYYGGNRPPSVINGRSNWMIIRFHSNRIYEEKGFNATYQKRGLCLANQEPCGLGEEDCYVRTQHCDGKWDCKMRGGDEKDCGSCHQTVGPSSGLYPCGGDTTHCYEEKERCNGLAKCKNTADEIGCIPEQCGAHNGTFLCGNTRCIYDTWRCDQTDDCGDSSDEDNCPVSRRVIIAAVIGSLICALLLVVALGCTCKLYSLRIHEHYGSHTDSAMSRVQAHFNRRPAPPTYHEAMGMAAPQPNDALDEGDRLGRSASHVRRSRARRGSRSGRPPRPPPPRGSSRQSSRSAGHSGEGSSTREHNSSRDNHNLQSQSSGSSPCDAPSTQTRGTDTRSPPHGPSPDSVNSTNAAASLARQSSTTCLIPPSTTSDSEGDSDQDSTEINLSPAAGGIVQFRRGDYDSRLKASTQDGVFQNVPNNINNPPSSSVTQPDSVSADTMSASCDTDSAMLSLDDPTDKQEDGLGVDSPSEPVTGGGNSSVIPTSEETRHNTTNLSRSRESLNSVGSDERLIQP